MKKKMSTKKPASPRTGKVTIQPPKPDPEPTVEIHEAGSTKEVFEEETKALKVEKMELTEKPITFFSRYREDQIVLEQAHTEQVGSNKWVTIPARICAFHDRAYVTNDQEKIDFIRNHPRYGFELFEFGNDKHQARIETIDDSGRILELERQGKLARIMESRERA